MDFYIVSHQNRIKSIIKNYFNINISLPNCGLIHIYQNKIKIIYPNNDKIEYKSNFLMLPSNINIYLIRHAEAQHNVMSKFKRIFIWNSDPSITRNGHIQIENLLDIIKKIYNKNRQNIFCSSELYRTQQTAFKIMKGLGENKKIIILPNIGEIIFENELLNNTISSLVPENKSKYRNLSYLNWFYYNNFQNDFLLAKQANDLFQFIIQNLHFFIINNHNALENVDMV